jgi:DNA-directed RNA polymerase sigma subunit (sigma70/sigma32)
MDKKDLSTWFESLSEGEKELVKLRFRIAGEEPLTLKENIFKTWGES